MNTVAERLLDLHLSGATIIERGYRTIPPDWFVDASDREGHVQSWTECFPGVPQPSGPAGKIGRFALVRMLRAGSVAA